MPRKLEGIIRPTPSDIDVAQACTPLPIAQIAASLGLGEDDYAPYGHTKAKLSLTLLQKQRDRASGAYGALLAVSL